MPDIYLYSPQQSWKVGISTPLNKWEHRGSEVKAAQLGRGRSGFQI